MKPAEKVIKGKEPKGQKNLLVGVDMQKKKKKPYNFFLLKFFSWGGGGMAYTSPPPSVVADMSTSY
jgi:hypothetical protein